MRNIRHAFAIVALILSSCKNEAPAPVSTEGSRKFYRDSYTNASAVCRAPLEYPEQKMCTLSARFGIDSFRTSIRFQMDGEGSVMGGEIVLDQERTTILTFYNQRCDDYDFALHSCPGSGRYRLLIRQEDGPLVEIWSRRLVPRAQFLDPPTFILDNTSQPVLDAIVDFSRSRRAELQFVPDNPSIPTMSKTVNYLVPDSGGPAADIALGYELISKANYALGSYGN